MARTTRRLFVAAALALAAGALLAPPARAYDPDNMRVADVYVVDLYWQRGRETYTTRHFVDLHYLRDGRRYAYYGYDANGMRQTSDSMKGQGWKLVNYRSTFWRKGNW